MAALKSTGRSKVILAGLIFALIGAGFWRGADVWIWATTKVVYIKNSFRNEVDSVTLLRIHRWIEHGEDDPLIVLECCWRLETGMPSHRTYTYSDLSWRRTEWRTNGTVYQQRLRSGEVRGKPPWLWGDSDQSEPTAPWILEGMTFDAWWDSLPDFQKKF